MTEEEEIPPYDLDEYIDWATKKVSSYNNRLSNYQLRALLCLPAVWVLIAMHTWWFGFITVEPDVGAIAGRVLKGVVNNSCTADQIALYGASCPELAYDTCGPENDTDRPEYRELWEYRDEENSARAEFNMVFCSDKPNFVTRINVDFWLGYGFGVVTGGLVSDSFGRQFGFYIYLTCMLVTALAMTISHTGWTLGIARVLNGIGVGGAGIIGYVWTSESLNPESMQFMGWVPWSFYCIGGCFPSIMSLVVSRWRVFSWVMTASCIPFFFVPLACFQSPKWLAYTKNREAVTEVINGIMAVNGEPELAPPPSKDDPRIISLIQSLPDPIPEDCRALCHRRVFPRLIMSCLLWFTVSYCYYGMSLIQPPALFGDGPVGLVMAWCFSFIVEIPGYLGGSYFMSRPRWGRKGVTCYCMIAGGGLLMFIGIQEWAPESLYWVFEILYFPARLIIAAAFGVVYIWTLELFPNSIRNTALGISSFAARMGTSLAPVAGRLDLFHWRMLSFGVPAILVGACCLFSTLPETRGVPLPGYLDDLDEADEATV